MYKSMLMAAAAAGLVMYGGAAQAAVAEDEKPAAHGTAKSGDKPTGADKSGLSIKGSVRARIEAIDGQFRPGAPDDDVLLSFRTLIHARYDFGGVHLVGELNDARTYLQKINSPLSAAETNALEPLQAYIGVDLHSIGGVDGKGVVKAGRFTTKVGSGRLIDRTDWYNSPYSYLGIELDWKSKKGDRVHLFATQPFERLPYSGQRLRDAVVEPDRTGPALRLSGLSLTAAKLFAGANLEAFGMWLDEEDNARRATKDRQLFTFGGRFYRYASKGEFDFELEGALQHGTTRLSTSAADVTDRRVRAGMSHFELGYTFPSPAQPRVAAIFDYASGDTTGPDYTRFDPLFGKRRSDFGPISLYSAVSRGNVVSPGVLLEVKPNKSWDVMVKARKFWLASATDTFGSTGLRDLTGAAGKDAGGQLEWAVGTDLAKKRLRAEFGSAWLMKGAFMHDAPGATNNGDTIYGFFDLSMIF